jgi:hypothetical protein
MKRIARSLALGLLLAPAAASAQSATDSGLSIQDILGVLVTNRGVQTGDFDRDQAAASATRATLARALLAAITTLPVSGSSSGFVYRLNPTLGTVERTSDTFGPFFVERAITSGRGQASAGFTFQYASFHSLDGKELRDGSFVTTANQFTDEPTPFDVETLRLGISTRTATVFGTIGVSDRIDIGGAIPIVRLDVDGSRVNTYRGNAQLQAAAEGRKMGLGDISVRTKVRLTGDGSATAAAGAEVRLPTGSEEDLMGAGDTALRLLGMGSFGRGPANVYGNVAIGFGGIGRELSSSGAVTFAASARLTVVGELLVRRIEGIQEVTAVTEPHPRIGGVRTLRLLPSGADQTSAYAVTGFKWNAGDTWLLHAHVLMPLTETGLASRVTPTLALEYAFTR